MKKREYKGERRQDGVYVEVIGYTDSGNVISRNALPMCLHLANHSPSGFEWGYSGSGPAQLALAILTDCLGAKMSVGLYQMFKDDVIRWMPRTGQIGESWTMTSKEVWEWYRGVVAGCSVNSMDGMDTMDGMDNGREER